MSKPVILSGELSSQGLPQRPQIWGPLLGVLLLVPFIVLPILDLYPADRILHWHITQPSYSAAIIELIVLFLLLSWGLSRKTYPYAAAAIGMVAFVYLRRHHVDVPALTALCYFELILATGFLVVRGQGRVTTVDSSMMLAHSFVWGLAVWVCIFLASSLFDFGRPKDLRIVVGVGALPIFLLARTKPLSLKWLQRSWQLEKSERWWFAGFIAWLLVLTARTNSVTGYDPLWYGFRPQFVLAPEHSLFDETGLVSPVFYFPKLFELLLMPLSAFSDFSYPLAINLGILALTAYFVYDLSRFFGVNRNMSFAAAAVAISLPAIANTALTPKPDLVAGLLCLISFRLALHCLRCFDSSALILALCSCLLAVQCKLVTVPYIGALVIAVAIVWSYRRSRPHDATQVKWTPVTSASKFCLILCLIATALLTWRTWSLTGMPTVGPDPLIKIWHFLGFQFKEPTGTFQWTWPQVWSEVPMIALDMMFNPSRLSNIVITWIGNIWIWCAIFACICALSSRRRSSMVVIPWSLLFPLMACGLAITFGMRLHSRGGDGNYLIVPLLVVIPAFVALLAKYTTPHSQERVVALVGIVCAAAFQSTYCLANASWSDPGTRRLDWRFTDGVNDTKTLRGSKLQYYGLADVEAALRKMPGHKRIVGLTRDDSGYWLSAQYESIDHIMASRPEYIATKERFFHFLRLAKIDLVIVPITASDSSPHYRLDVVAFARSHCAAMDNNCDTLGEYLLVRVAGAR